MSPARVGTRDLRGYIVPVGGAEDKVSDVDILRRFTEIAGGKHARIAIIPTASVLSETGSKYEKLFDQLGARDATALPYAERPAGCAPCFLTSCSRLTPPPRYSIA